MGSASVDLALQPRLRIAHARTMRATTPTTPLVAPTIRAFASSEDAVLDSVVEARGDDGGSLAGTTTCAKELECEEHKMLAMVNM